MCVLFSHGGIATGVTVVKDPWGNRRAAIACVNGVEVSFSVLFTPICKDLLSFSCSSIPTNILVQAPLHPPRL